MDSTISSRTPEGFSSGCPLCGKDFKLAPSTPTSDVPCPNCGHLLWVAAFGENHLIFDREKLPWQAKEKLEEIINDEQLDSLDKAEALMKLEDQYGL